MGARKKETKNTAVRGMEAECFPNRLQKQRTGSFGAWDQTSHVTNFTDWTLVGSWELGEHAFKLWAFPQLSLVRGQRAISPTFYSVLHHQVLTQAEMSGIQVSNDTEEVVGPSETMGGARRRCWTSWRYL